MALKKLVIIPGGFHPFHAGHKALYDAAVAQFPKADVFIAATDDKSNRPFPFKLKKTLAGIAGIPAHRFVQVKSPFQPREIRNSLVFGVLWGPSGTSGDHLATIIRRSYRF